MATLTQQPSEWNMAYMPNVFTVASSTGIAALRVLVNGVEVALLKQTENPSGKCHFDVSKVLQSYLETSFVEETPLLTQSNGEVLSYRVQYGEVPVSGGLPVYSGYSFYRYVINGYSNWRDLNWNSASYVPTGTEFECPGGQSFSAIVNPAEYLTNYPSNYQIADNEYHTLSFINKVKTVGLAYMQEQPYFAVYKFYNASDVLIGENIYALSDATGLGPRVDCNDLGQYTFTVNELVGHIGAGPQNLKDAGIWQACDHYTISIYSMDYCYYEVNGPISDCDDIGELADYLDAEIYSRRFDVTEYCTPFEPIRLSFVNQYGMKDYYTFDKRNTYTVETKRQNYLETLGTWEASTFTIPQQGRGFRTFASEISETMSLSTNWVDTDVAKWMQELFTSPSVMIYKAGQWEPCVITSNTYQEMTKARQKLFRYEISVQYSNQKTVQRG